MTAEQRDADLRRNHPKLWDEYHHGTLLEPGSDFIKVVKQLKREQSEVIPA